MMENVPPLLARKILVVLHRACSEMRYLEDRKRVFDLADTVEFIPMEMLHWRADSEESVRWALRDYQKKYPGTGADYLRILDMDEETFRSSFLESDTTTPQAIAFIENKPLASVPK